MADTYVTAHFTLEELACHDEARTPYPVIYRKDRLPDLLVEAEAIRAECCIELGADCPIVVVSGFRTVEYNASLAPAYKASAVSQHCEGRALDIVALRLSYSHLKAAVKRAAQRPGSLIMFIEWRPAMGYCHVDTFPRRPDRKLVTVTIV